MTREELLRNPAYWTSDIQMELYRQITTFMEKQNMNKTQLAEHLGCSKGYVTQLLSGDFDHKLSKFVELALAVNKIPQITFSDVDEYILSDSHTYSVKQVVNTKESEASYHSPESVEYQTAA